MQNTNSDKSTKRQQSLAKALQKNLQRRKASQCHGQPLKDSKLSALL